MPRRRISFDVAVNMPSAQREADRLANVFQNRLRNIQVGTSAGSGGARGGGGGGGRSSSGGGGGFGPFGDTNILQWLGNTAGFAVSGMFYQMFSNIPRMVQEIDALATTNRRATASFATLAGGVDEANSMIDAYIQGTGGAADRVTATTEAMRLFNIGMAENADQMRAFTTLSRGMSTALGRPVDYIQEQFSLALANQSQLRFDQLGLSLERHKELMDEIKEQNPEVTREVAFQNAMLQQAAERYYNLANAQEALATSSEILGRQLRDTRAVLADFISTRVTLPIAGDIAQLLGAEDYNLDAPNMRNVQRDYLNHAEWTREGNWQAIPGNIARTFQAPFSGNYYADQKEMDIAKYESSAQMAGTLADAMDAVQAAANSGVEINDQWVNVLNSATGALHGNVDETSAWTEHLTHLISQVDEAMNAQQLLGDELMRTGDAAAQAAAEVADLNSRLVGVAQGMIGRMIEAGASPELVRGMAPTEDQIMRQAEALQAMAAEQGNVIDDAIALALAEERLYGEMDQWIEDAQETERAQKRAASEMESAAKASEKAFLNAADGLVNAYEDMLNKVEGLFNTSKVTEEDMKLAELGYAVNYPDDALRRLEDVAFNKKQRDDVDIDMWAQALGMSGADPVALALNARKRWESGSLWANPENISNLLNVDAVKSQLHDQEMAALGTQNLKAFFGLGSDEGNEFLRVFGMEALDPIQDGLISEITTRGPIMGRTLADALYTGFDTRSLELPWVASIMRYVDSVVGQAILNGMNNDASGSTADAESLPLE